MTLSELTDKTLRLMDEYSVNGVLVNINANKDYYNRIPVLANDAQKIAAKQEGFYRQAMLSSLTRARGQQGGLIKYVAPEGFQQIFKLYSASFNGELPYIELGGAFFVPECISEGILLYRAAPQTIGPNTDKEYAFEVSDDAQTLLPYYVAAKLLETENSPLTDSLYAEWRMGLDGLHKLYPKISAFSLSDVYPELIKSEEIPVCE